MTEREREREVVASIVTAVCGEEEVQEVVAYVLSPLLYPSLIVISLQSVGCHDFSHIWVSTLTSCVSSHLLFISVFFSWA